MSEIRFAREFVGNEVEGRLDLQEMEVKWFSEDKSGQKMEVKGFVGDGS